MQRVMTMQRVMSDDVKKRVKYGIKLE